MNHPFAECFGQLAANLRLIILLIEVRSPNDALLNDDQFNIFCFWRREFRGRKPIFAGGFVASQIFVFLIQSTLHLHRKHLSSEKVITLRRLPSLQFQSIDPPSIDDTPIEDVHCWVSVKECREGPYFILQFSP